MLVHRELGALKPTRNTQIIQPGETVVSANNLLSRDIGGHFVYAAYNEVTKSSLMSRFATLSRANATTQEQMNSVMQLTASLGELAATAVWLGGGVTGQQQDIASGTAALMSGRRFVQRSLRDAFGPNHPAFHDTDSITPGFTSDAFLDSTRGVLRVGIYAQNK